MSHLLDESKGSHGFVAFAEPGWHGLGTVQFTAISAADALHKSGQDYTVLKMPNVHIYPEHGCIDDKIIETTSEDSFFTFRTDTGKVLGSKLGRDYTVLQNIDALNIADEILQSGTATIETAGCIDEGRKVFICLKINKDIIVGGKDLINQYVLITTSHDGSISITVLPTNVRVVCNNTLTAALHGSVGKIKIRHTTNADERLREAAKVLNLISTNTEVNSENYAKMKATVISKEEMWSYFGNLFLTPKEIHELQQGKRAKEVISTKKSNILDTVHGFALGSGEGQELTMHGQDYTMWSAYNAVTAYATRRKFEDVSARADSMFFGTAAKLVETAGVLAMDKAKIQPLHSTKINFNLN